MAAKMSPEQLRQQARKLIEQAQAQEQKRHQLIGQLVADHIEEGFNGFDLELFRRQARQIWKEGRFKKAALKRAPQGKAPESLSPKTAAV